MDILTTLDLENEKCYTYAEMLRLYKDKINEIIANNNAKLTPSIQQTTSASNKFVFDETSPKGVYMFTYGYCQIIFILYDTPNNTRFKITGPSIYGEGGSVRNIIYNVKYIDEKVEISSGTSEYPLFNGLTGYLSKIELN